MRNFNDLRFAFMMKGGIARSELVCTGVLVLLMPHMSLSEVGEVIYVGPCVAWEGVLALLPHLPS